MIAGPTGDEVVFAGVYELPAIPLPPGTFTNAPNPVIGTVGEPDETGRAEIILNDAGRHFYGPHVTFVVDGVSPPADEPLTVEARDG